MPTYIYQLRLFDTREEIEDGGEAVLAPSAVYATLVKAKAAALAMIASSVTPPPSYLNWQEYEPGAEFVASVSLPSCYPDSRPVACPNCDWSGDLADCQPLPDQLRTRPDHADCLGECPECAGGVVASDEEEIMAVIYRSELS